MSSFSTNNITNSISRMNSISQTPSAAEKTAARKTARRTEKKPATRITLRIPGALYRRMKCDLERPHPFADERVGFLFVRTGRLEAGGLLLLGHAYHALADERYLDDPKAGARIDSGAIREAMQKVLDGQGGAFHVHLHNHVGKPRYSGMDLSEQPSLIKSFQTIGSASPHGTLVLSQNNGIASVWLPGSGEPVSAAKISVVGAPMLMWEGTRK